MRLEWLEDILAVVDCGSLQAAAEKRHLSQPAFSRRLRAMEQALGAPLFDRRLRPIRLLPHVQDQVERMRELGVGLRELNANLRNAARSRRRHLVIAAQHAITTATAPRLLERLATLDLEIRLRSANREECMALLMTREADLALVYDVAGEVPLARAEFIQVEVIGAEPLIPVCAPAALQRLNNAFEQGELPVIAYPAEVFLGVVQRRLVFPELARFTQVSIRLVTALTPAALQFARAGFGVAWLPRCLVAEDLARATMVAMEPRLPTIPMRLLATRLLGEASPVTGAVWGRIVAGCQMPAQIEPSKGRVITPAR